MEGVEDGHGGGRGWTCREARMDMEGVEDGHGGGRGWTWRESRMDMEGVSALYAITTKSRCNGVL